MSTPVFSFTENPFDNGTKTSKKKMNIIAGDHVSKLHSQMANPLIAVLYAFFNPIRQNFLNKYSQWISVSAAYHGATVALELLMAQLRGDKIEDFDIRVQVVYKRGTPQYAALFPNFRIPFQSGGYDERIAKLKALGEGMDVDPAFALIKADVDAFYLLIFNARDAQQDLEGSKQFVSDELELLRIVTAQAMYYTLGGLMQVFSVNTFQITMFYDLETLRGHITDTIDLIFDGPANGNTIVNVLGPDVLQYVTGVTLRIKNTTAGPAIGGLFFYAADNATDGWNGLGQQLNPGEEATITLTAAQFRAFFNVQNQGPNLQTYEVEIILPE